jgi:hypothetical protein
MKGTRPMLSREEAHRLADEHIAKGRHVEAAWTLTALRGAPADVSDYQIEAMRACFYLGADFVVQMLVTGEDRGWTPEDAAAHLVVLLNELDKFILGRSLQAARNGETEH